MRLKEDLGIKSVPAVSNHRQRLGMMALLGQHGQSLDYERGVRLISFAAETADENAPQGAYVRRTSLNQVTTR